MFIKKDKNTRATDLAFMGIMLAINQILLYFGGMTNFNETFFLCGASLIIGIVVVEKGIKNGIVFYISSAMMAVVLMPNKLTALGYIFILGLYTIIKYYIEKIENQKKEWIFKTVYFIVLSIVTAFLSREIFSQNIVILIIPMVIGIMIVYDYAVSVLLSAYMKKFNRL